MSLRELKERLRKDLQSPRIDWQDVYLTINSTLNDTTFQGAAFWRLPGTLIFETYKWCKRQYAKRINDQSRSIARLCELQEIIGSQGKSNPNWENYLPFKIEPDEGENPFRLPDAVQATIRLLIKRGRVPMSIAVLLRAELDGSGPNPGIQMPT